MASNTWGQLFKMTTWGESHGVAVGVVIDGCPAGLPVSVEAICTALARRRPGNNVYTSPRKERDQAVIESGLFEGVTTGAPLSIRIPNVDADPRQYMAFSHLMRPGHATYTYLKKYGVFDYRGGGRASARETACRVAAGAVAQCLLDQVGITVCAYLDAVGPVCSTISPLDDTLCAEQVFSHDLYCPDSQAQINMQRVLQQAKNQGDSWGGGCWVCGQAIACWVG